MPSAWLLPEHIADVLPAEAARIEQLRRSLLDRARSCGFELVIPPLLEHLESLLSGTGRELDLRTFKLVDQLSGRLLGLRADTTPQAARIDAHLLNHDGVTRLCYCGPVLHARPQGLRAGREPLQFGAEIFGHAGLEADLEAQELALDALHGAGVVRLVIDLADARVLRGVLAGVPMDATRLQDLVQALSEAIAFGRHAGLDMKLVLDVIGKGAAQSWQLDNRGKTMVDGQFDFGFAVDWMRKDLGLVLDEARRVGASTPVTALVDQFYADVQAAGGGRWDTSSLITRLK